jgi:plastocyanin
MKIAAIFKYSLILIVVLTSLVLFSSCGSGTSTPTVAPATTLANSPTTPAPTATPQNVTKDLTAQNIAFDLKTINVPAGSVVTINFVNKDTVPHNFALYTDSSANTPLFVGKVINKGQITYNFNAPDAPGSYFFRCDVHPLAMVGTFIVQ